MTGLIILLNMVTIGLEAEMSAMALAGIISSKISPQRPAPLLAEVKENTQGLRFGFRVYGLG